MPPSPCHRVQRLCSRVQVISEHPQAGAAVQDEVRAARDSQFQARGVTAVAIRIALERRRGAAHSPEGQFGAVLRHGGAIPGP